MLTTNNKTILILKQTLKILFAFKFTTKLGGKIWERINMSTNIFTVTDFKYKTQLISIQIKFN